MKERRRCGDGAERRPHIGRGGGGGGRRGGGGGGVHTHTERCLGLCLAPLGTLLGELLVNGGVELSYRIVWFAKSHTVML